MLHVVAMATGGCTMTRVCVMWKEWPEVFCIFFVHLSCFVCVEVLYVFCLSACLSSDGDIHAFGYLYDKIMKKNLSVLYSFEGENNIAIRCQNGVQRPAGKLV